MAPSGNLLFDLDIASLRQELGFCWTFTLPDEVALGDRGSDPDRSQLRLFENGVALGPAHASHDQIRSHGRGLYSHWNNILYFSTSDNRDPRTSGVKLSIEAQARREGEDDEPVKEDSSLFPTLNAAAKALRDRDEPLTISLLHNPTGSIDDRVRMLEAKVEYLLDELYAAKSQLQFLAPQLETITDLQQYQVESFDYQWRSIRYHDHFLSNPAWREKAVDDLCQRSGFERDWFKGKTVLDCGCGPGRHAWAFSSLGAKVTAFDMSDSGLEEARRHCEEFPDTVIEKRSILLRTTVRFIRSRLVVWGNTSHRGCFSITQEHLQARKAERPHLPHGLSRTRTIEPRRLHLLPRAQCDASAHASFQFQRKVQPPRKH